MQIQVVDEHQEAYLCIEDAFRSGMFRRPITLIHVDSHADLEGPFTTMSCYHRDYRKYVSRYLGVGEFIVPLILRGRIDAVCFVNRDDSKRRQRLAGSFQGRGFRLVSDVPRAHCRHYPDTQRWSYYESTDLVSLGRHIDPTHCVLDIDCDYFSNNLVPRSPLCVQRTAAKQGYPDCPIVSADDHRIPLWILPCQYATMRPLQFNASSADVKLCIDFFTYYLRLSPVLTIISRSVKSGFTPVAHGQLIEKRLLRQLLQRPSSVIIPSNMQANIPDFVISTSSFLYNAFNNIHMPLDPVQSRIIADIRNGRSLADIGRRLKRSSGFDDATAIYYILRFVFHLKRWHFLD